MKQVINFGKIPLANSLLDDVGVKVKRYSLKLGFDTKTSLLQIIDNAPPSELFTADYVYDSSSSKPMVKHFKQLAATIKKKHKIKKILEIGANSGAFIDNFTTKQSIAVEPCLNFADRLKKKKITTYDEMWTEKLSKKIEKKHGKVDVVFSSNTISHIQNLNECFRAISNILKDDGMLVIETPSLLDIMSKGSIDLFYHEHHSYFSCISMNRLLWKHGMYVSDVKNTSVHGGSYVFYIRKHKIGSFISPDVLRTMQFEYESGLSNFEYIKGRMKSMLMRAKEFGEKLVELKEAGNIIIAYGATAKLCSLLNIIGVGKDVIDFVYDTTPYKANKYIPGVDIEILPYNKEAFQSLPFKHRGYTDVYCILGAWNYTTEILNKEETFLDNGGIFITHIPQLAMISRDKKK